MIKGIRDLVGCGSCYDNYAVYVSEPIDIRAEWRCFIMYDSIVDVRPYGNPSESWRYRYDPGVICGMMDRFLKWDGRPASCSMGIGVALIEPGVCKTVLIEFNDAYALGCYGLDTITYAKLISARWSQLLGRKDEYHFN